MSGSESPIGLGGKEGNESSECGGVSGSPIRLGGHGSNGISTTGSGGCGILMGGGGWTNLGFTVRCSSGGV